MSHKDDSGRQGAIHHGADDAKKNHAGSKDPKGLIAKGPGKQNPNPGDRGPHGGGEGETGMQPGAGHPRGR
jgi:hypothetical protein